MLYLTCTTISSVDLAQYGVSLAKDWVSVECGTKTFANNLWRKYLCYLCYVGRDDIFLVHYFLNIHEKCIVIM